MSQTKRGPGGAREGAGRPSIYTIELGESICERIASGEDMLSICEDDDMPSTVTVWRWSRDDPDFERRLSHARSHQAHMLAQESIHRARAAHDVGTASAARAFVDAARFTCPAFNRATFGAQVQHEVNVTRTLSDDELKLRLIEALALRPELIPLALARQPELEPALRARGLLTVVEARAKVDAAAPPAKG